MKQYMNSHFDFCMDRKPKMTWNWNKNLFPKNIKLVCIQTAWIIRWASSSFSHWLVIGVCPSIKGYFGILRTGRTLWIGGCQVIIWKARPWIILGNVLGECHALYTPKNSCRFRRSSIIPAIEDYIFVTTQTLHAFSEAVKSHRPSWPNTSLISTYM
jgi:hypothetical protein